MPGNFWQSSVCESSTRQKAPDALQTGASSSLMGKSFRACYFASEPGAAAFLTSRSSTSNTRTELAGIAGLGE